MDEMDQNMAGLSLRPGILLPLGEKASLDLGLLCEMGLQEIMDMTRPWSVLASVGLRMAL
jgi:hypothetical protein